VVKKNKTMKKYRIYLWTIALTVVLFSCNREQDPIPEPDPTKNKIEMVINDFDGNGLLPGIWSSTNDGAEMTDYKLAVNPKKGLTDTVLYMSGTDENKNWWIGTSLGGDRMGQPFGLPADASKTVIQFEVYATTSNSNLELQLQEADGDVFSWNLGGDGGYQPTAGEWITYQSAPLSEFNLAGFNNGGQGDGKFAAELLANVSIALISGNSTGKTSSIYINNVVFVVTEVSHVARPTNLKAQSVSKNQINLSWSDNSANEIGFEIERAFGSGAYAVVATVPANTTRYSDMELTANTSYSYRVRAITENKQSVFSNVAKALTFPNAVIEMLIINFDRITGKVVSGWSKTSDGAQMTDCKVVINPIGNSTTDSVLYMKGIDSDSDWWIGTALFGDDKNGTPFGLPEDASKVMISFEMLAGNGSANIDIQLQEKDGDVFTWNFGGDGGYQASQTAWTTYTVPLTAFKLASWANKGDNIFSPELLSNLSIALISGGSQGNEAIAYINNVKFIISE
jgi:hypothetical protein